MRKVVKILLFVSLPFIANAQQTKLDSLRKVLLNATTDSVVHNVYSGFYFYYREVNRDSALYYIEKRLDLAKQNSYRLAEAAALVGKGYQYTSIGRYSESFENLLQALTIAEDPQNEEQPGWRIMSYTIPGSGRLVVAATAHHILSLLMRATENPEQEIVELKKGLAIAVQINDVDRQMQGNMNLGRAYLLKNQIDSALYFATAAQLISDKYLINLYRGLNANNLGNIYRIKGDKDLAVKYYYEGLQSAKLQNNQNDLATIHHSLIDFYLKENERDSALMYAVKNLNVVESLGGIVTYEYNIGTAYEDLYLAYKLSNQDDSAHRYQSIAYVVKDSLYKKRIKNLADFQKLSLGEAMRLESLEKEKIQMQSRLRIYSLLAGMVVLTIIGFLLYRNNRQNKKANTVLEKTLFELKATQRQLIQSEKMASLGELTAGIAHEIQNPLNFVNNFSEVSAELIDEMKTELTKGDVQEGLAIANVLQQNLEKINHHGKRADAIVKGMLEHSRAGSGERVLTDINALADEYLRLAYHGLRAKDKNFNADLQTNFDPSIGLVNIIPQDIGRVVLNLINNALYAVNERSKRGEAGYKPLVKVYTEKWAQGLRIGIEDNGGGIPEAIKEKIFQPFFTTKPTGQGTGLGLSLSYDIVKAYGGELKVEATAGEGSTLFIQIPMPGI